MRFAIAGKQYSAASVDRLTLRHFMEMETHTAKLNRPMKWGEIRAMVQRISSLPPADAETDDDFLWFVGICIWASRFEAGEEISLDEAVDFPIGELEILPDPQDHQAPGGGAGGPRAARPGSGRAGKRKQGKARKRASAPPSSGGSSSSATSGQG